MTRQALWRELDGPDPREVLWQPVPEEVELPLRVHSRGVVFGAST